MPLTRTWQTWSPRWR
ncbi:hypothetical protein MC885_008523 [Smutsia gigantea]|nr:hypothetical protein MC885_008523 [Smutsia gigantea]